MTVQIGRFTPYNNLATSMLGTATLTAPQPGQQQSSSTTAQVN